MSDKKSKSMIRHPMALWGLFIVLLFVVWFGGWFVLANYAEGKIEEVTADLQEQGVDLVCDDRSIRGFPFRIGVACDRVSITNPSEDFAVQTGALRSTAILYSPGEMIAELDGPAEASFGGAALSANWDLMRLYTDAQLSGGFDRVSLNFTKLVSQIGADKLTVDDGAVHLRPTPGELNSLDVALEGKDIVPVLANGLRFPKASIAVDAKMVDGYKNLVLARRNLPEVMAQGGQFDLRSGMLVTKSGGKLALSGPLELNNDGTLSGSLRIGLINPEEVSSWVAQIDPQLQQIVAFAQQAMAGMGTPSRIAGEEMQTIKVMLKRGEVRLGFIKVGKIPPLR